MSLPTVMTDDSLTVYIAGEAYTVPRDWHGFEVLKSLLNEDPVDEQAVLDHVGGYDPNFKTRAFTVADDVSLDDIEVTTRRVFFRGQAVDTNLTRRLLDVQAQGLPIDPWLKFMSNVYENPADYARSELYDWVERSDLPITDDGCFLAYKRVMDNGPGANPRYTDIHSNTFNNDVGIVVEMDRRNVDTNRARHCSSGLHFCSKEYLPSFGSHGNGHATLIVKVNPADVVSIPDDYNFSKGRTWRYEVIQAIPDEVNPSNIEWQDPVVHGWAPPVGDPVVDPVVSSDWPWDDEDEWGDETDEWDDEPEVTAPITFDGDKAISSRVSPAKRARNWWRNRKS